MGKLFNWWFEINHISAINKEAVKWRKNLFLLSSRKGGKDYITHSPDYYIKWINNNQSRQSAIKFMMIKPSLLFQKSSQTSKSKDHTECLKRGLKLWKVPHASRFQPFAKRKTVRSDIYSILFCSILFWENFVHYPFS